MEKKKVLVVGSSGRMGSLVIHAIEKSSDFAYWGGYCLPNETTDFTKPIITSYADFPYITRQFGTPDIIIDFSKPPATIEVLKYASEYSCNKIPMVIATTNFSKEQQEIIDSVATKIPIFQSSNMSYSVNVVIKLLEVATSLLGDNYEIGIHETHHSGKVDAPSGTATMFFNAINKASGDNLIAVYGSSGKKQDDEVWISSQRCGNFPGEHIVTFAGKNDFIRIEHFATNPSMFAEGALDAARFLLKQTEPRIYTMADMF